MRLVVVWTSPKRNCKLSPLRLKNQGAASREGGRVLSYTLGVTGLPLSTGIAASVWKNARLRGQREGAVAAVSDVPVRKAALFQG